MENENIMGYCKDCKFRDAEDFQYTNRESGKRRCLSPKLTSDSYNNPEYSADDSLIYAYDEGGGFYVGDLFGCVHWMPQPPNRLKSD